MPDSDAESKEWKPVSLPRGAYSRIARRLRVTPQHVREVALKGRPSARVRRSIEAELRKAERQGQAA